MKGRIIGILAALTIISFAYQAMAKGPQNVGNTKHNLAAWSQAATLKSDNVNEVCVFCHTPHMAEKNVRSPLWNKEVTTRSSGGSTWRVGDLDDPQGATTFIAYTTHYTKMPRQLGYETLLCMSCHDGVSALNVVHNVPNSVTAITFSGDGTPQIGDTTRNVNDIGDTWVQGPVLPDAYTYYSDGWGMMLGLYTIDQQAADGIPENERKGTGDHPISINYDDVLTKASTKFRTKALTGLPFYGAGQSQLECTTCHDVHVNYNVALGGDARYRPFLNESNRSSAMCFRCHIK